MSNRPPEQGSARELESLSGLLGAVVESAPAGIAVLDSSLRYRFANRTYSQFLDEPYRSGGPAGYTLVDVLGVSDATRIVTGVRDTGEAYVNPEYRFEFFERGTTYWNLSVQRLESGDVLIVAVETTHQVLARKRVEQLAAHRAKDLRELELRTAELESLFANSPLGLTFFDREHRYIRINPALAEINGVPAEEHVGRTIEEILPANAPIVVPILDRVFATAKPEHHQIAGQTPREPGVTRHWMAGFYPVLSGGPEPLAVGAYVIEITEHKRAEQAMRESEERFRTLADNMSQFAWMTDAQGSIFWYNKRWYDYTGTTPEEMNGWGWTKVHHPDYVDGVVERFRKAVESGVEWEDTFPLRGHDGNYRWFLSRAIPIRQDGRVVRWFGTNTDITAQRDAEEEVRRSTKTLTAAHRQLEAVIDGAPNTIVFVKDLDGRFLTINAFLEQILGITREEIRGKSDYDLVSRERADLYREHDRSVIATGISHHYEEPLIGVDGKERIFYSSKFPLLDSDGKPYSLCGISVDITDRKLAEDAAQKNFAQLRAVIDAMAEGMCVANSAGILQLFNSAFLEIYGFSASEAPKEIGRLDTLIEAEEMDGTPVPLDHLPINEALAGRSVRNRELKVRRKDKDYTVVLRHNVEPVRNAAGEVILAVATVEDVTAIRKAERALIQNEKLASVGRMAATIAHEINNPLAAVMNSLFLVGTDKGLGHDARRHLDIAEEELARVAHITRQTLGFYRETGAPRQITLPPMIDGVLDLYAPRLRTKGVEIIKSYKADGIHAIPGEIRQVISNLLSNSFDALNEQGRLYLRTRFRLSRAGEKMVAITVADTGSGIAKEHQRHLFEPFFTTKQVVGTGLGLWVSKDMVEKHGGKITVRSRAGAGTVFTVLLPATASERDVAA